MREEIEKLLNELEAKTEERRQIAISLLDVSDVLSEWNTGFADGLMIAHNRLSKILENN